jgi:hypothetical protein
MHNKQIIAKMLSNSCICIHKFITFIIDFMHTPEFW